MLMCWSVNMLFDSLKINNNHNFDFGHLLLDLVLFVCLFVFRKKQQKANNTQKIVIERQQIINWEKKQNQITDQKVKTEAFG